MSKESISRRQFIKGAAVGAVGITALSLSGCSGNTSSEQAQPTPAETIIEKVIEVNKGAETINPQDESYTSNTKELTKLFSPLQIGSITLPNRIVKSSAGSETTFLDSTKPSKECLSFYEQLCKGGAGMICFESGNVFGGMGMSLSMANDENVEAHKTLTEMVHSYGIPLLVQIAGDFSHFSSSKSHPSSLDQNSNSNVPMTTEEVHAFQQSVIDGAERYMRAGFDGVELNSSCSHTFDSFLSRFWNTERTDEYGPQSIENRARIVTEMIEGIKGKCGKDFIVQVLFSGVEENVSVLGDSSLCITPEEGIELAKLFEKAGADCLHIRSATFGNHAGGFMYDLLHYPEHGSTGFGGQLDFSRHLGGKVIGSYDGTCSLLDVAAGIKKNVSIPVGVVGTMDPRLAGDVIETALEEEKIDFILMTRPLLADSQLPNKLKDGRRDEIAPCTHCLTCFVGGLDFGTPMYCRVNPVLSRALGEFMPEGYDIPVSEVKNNVVVIGGGPAGMHAAVTAAKAGHTVTLFEKESELGGKMLMVDVCKDHHEKIADFRNYLIKQVELAGVDVRLGTEADADGILAESPDTVIVAAGGSFGASISGTNVVTGDTLMAQALGSGLMSVEGDNIVVLGGNFRACDIAINLRKQNKNVSIVMTDGEDMLDYGSPCWPKEVRKAWLHEKGIRIFSGASFGEAKDGTFSITTGYGIEMALAADAVVDMNAMLPNNSLAGELKGKVGAVVTAGDAFVPNTMAVATARAEVLARNIGADDLEARASEIGTCESRNDIALPKEPLI